MGQTLAHSSIREIWARLAVAIKSWPFGVSSQRGQYVFRDIEGDPNLDSRNLILTLFCLIIQTDTMVK